MPRFYAKLCSGTGNRMWDSLLLLIDKHMFFRDGCPAILVSKSYSYFFLLSSWSSLFKTHSITIFLICKSSINRPWALQYGTFFFKSTWIIYLDRYTMVYKSTCLVYLSKGAHGFRQGPRPQTPRTLHGHPAEQARSPWRFTEVNDRTGSAKGGTLW